VGLYSKIKSYLRPGARPLSRQDEVRLWWSRWDAAGRVYEGVREHHEKYERALRGDFGPIWPTQAVQYRGNTLEVDDTVPLNLFQRATTIYLGKAYDEFPTIRMVEPKGLTQAEQSEGERFLQVLSDDADVVSACRKAMRSSFTRGVFAVGVQFGSGVPDAERDLRGRIESAKIVMDVYEGKPVELGEGMDFRAIAEAARELLAGTREDGTENLARAALSDEQVTDLTALAQIADAKVAEEATRPKQMNGRTRALSATFLAINTDLRWDPTTTVRSRLKWMARAFTMTRDEFMSEERFTLKARKEVKPRSYNEVMGRRGAKVSEPSLKQDQVDQENECFFILEIHDRVHCCIKYVAEGYDDYLNDDQTYPHLNENGEALNDDFFPFEIAVPIEANGEDPVLLFGEPLLKAGWAPQIETIKNRTAWIRACKASGRKYRAAKGLDSTQLALLQLGVDGVIVEPPDNYDLARHGEFLTELDTSEPPKAYLDASLRSMADFANMVSLGMAELTGEPIADTAAQEDMALRGAATTQGDVVRVYERAFAGIVKRFAAIVRVKFSDEMIAAYGFDAGVVRKALGALRNCKLSVRFASTTRAEDLARQKTLMDFIALLNSLRNPLTGMPEYDPMPYVERLAKEMDLAAPTRWVPKPEDAQALMALQQMRAMMVMASGGPAGGGSAGGGNGSIPGEKKREEGPRNNARERVLAS